MVTVATGPTPPRPSIGGPIGRALGVAGGRKMVESEAERRAREEAEMLDRMLFGGARGEVDAGSTPAGGQVSAPGSGQRTPFDAAIPAVQSGTDRTVSRRGPEVAARPPAAGGEPGGTPGATGGDMGGEDIERDADELARASGPLGEMFRGLSREQRIAAIQTLRQSGMGAADMIALSGSERPTANTDMAKLRQDLQSGLITREEFQRERDRMLAGEGGDPLSTDELKARVIMQGRAGDITPEERDQVLALIDGEAGPELAASTRSFIMLDRRARGETIGNEQVDSLTPEQAAIVRDRVSSDPGKVILTEDPLGRTRAFDTEEGVFLDLFDVESGVAGGGGTETGTAGGGTAAGGGEQGSDRFSVVGSVATGEGELGVLGGVQTLFNAVKPQFGAQLSEPQREEVRNSLTLVRNRVTSALRASGRLLADERSELASMVPDPDAFLQSGPQAVAQLLAFKNGVSELRDEAAALAENNRLPDKQRRENTQLANELDVVLGGLRVPASAFAGANPDDAFRFAQALTPSTAGQLERDAAIALESRLTDEQLANMREQNPDTLRALLGVIESGNAR